MKTIFNKEDRKGIIRWIICVILIYFMGFAKTFELIIGIIGIFPVVLIVNLIKFISNKITKKEE